ncbi:MAG: hypothetical protein AAGD38_08465 [Acidobacteriota bacterium]
MERQRIEATSDVGELKGEIVVDIDPWIGYGVLCSDAFRQNLRRVGYAWTCHNDGGDYPERLRRLAAGESQLAVITVDAYLLNGGQYDFPGVQIFVIDESKGGDAIACWQDRIAGIDDLKNETGWKIAFTPGSPSHQLLRSMANDFGIRTLLSAVGDWRVETNGSGEALRRLVDRDVACAVLWQPDVARALSQEGIHVIHSSAVTNKVIVDVLLVGRDFAADNRSIVRSVTREYFTTLRSFRDNPEQHREELKDFVQEYGDFDPSDEQLASMFEGVAWVNLRDNAEAWLGVGGANRYFGLEEAHRFALEIIRAEEGRERFLADFQPAEVIWSEPVRDLYLASGAYDAAQGADTVTEPLTLPFEPLPAAEWDRLRAVGTLKGRDIVFERGSTTELNYRSREGIDQAMEDLGRYPRFRIELRVSHQESGDVEAKQRAALERGETVRQYLIDQFDLDEDRLRVIVQSPDQRRMRPGERFKAWEARLRQVEITLMTAPL